MEYKYLSGTGFPAVLRQLLVGTFMLFVGLGMVFHFFCDFYPVRKKIYHILFWCFYFCVNVYLDFNWARVNIPSWSIQQTLLKVSAGTLLYMLPLILLAYYLVYIAFEKIIQKKSTLAGNIFIILVPYVIAVCCSIVVMRLIVFPLIYDNAFSPGKHFFEATRFLSIMIEAAFPAGMLMSLKFIDVQLAAKEAEKNLVRERLSAELKFLKNQLNPHFLFNTLNNIYALTLKKSNDAPEAVMKLSGLLSFMLYDAAEDTIPIEKEIAFLEDYISLEKIRYGNTQLAVVFTKELDNPSQGIAPLLLLPLVENAFKHGASQNHFDSFIHIQLLLKNSQLLFTIENSCEEPAHTNKAGNIGLTNTARQLELMYKEQQLATSKSNNIFRASVSVNLNSYGKI